MYLLPIVVTPILSRIYSPYIFGEWGVFSASATIISIILFLGFENVIIKVNESEVKNISLLCFVVSIIVTGATFVIFECGSRFNLSYFCTFPETPILIVYLLLYSIYTIEYNIANRYAHYADLSITNLINGLGQATMRILLGVTILGMGNGLILGTTTALLFASVYLFYINKKKAPFHSEKFSFQSIKKLICTYKKFPLYDAPASLLSFSTFNLPIIILSFYFGKNEIGCFSIILQLLLMPMSLLGSAMGKIYYQELCGGTKSPEIITEQFIKILAILSVLPMLFLALGGDKIVIMFLGEKWATAGNVSLCLALWSFPIILTQPLLSIYRHVNKQNVMLCFDAICFAFSIGCILIMGEMQYSLYVILIAFSIICAAIKFGLFFNILFNANLSIIRYKKFFPLWIASILILGYRLLQIC